MSADARSDGGGSVQVAARLRDAGYELPVAPAPKGRYVGARRDGDTVRVSGHTDRGLAGAGPGPLQPDDDLGPAKAAAELAAVHLLAAASEVAGLDQLEVVHLRGYVASDPAFSAHPEIVDAASVLLDRLLPAPGGHTRAAIGVSSLPGRAVVELEAVLRVHERRPQASGGTR